MFKGESRVCIYIIYVITSLEYSTYKYIRCESQIIPGVGRDEEKIKRTEDVEND
jgi:hypothetical protein